jgi:hypothetical protein
MEEEFEYLAYTMFRSNDLYLVPLCLLILYFLVHFIRKKYKDTPIQKYIIPAITLRFVFAFVYTYVIGYYYGFGDSHNYYQGVLDMHKAVLDDNSMLIDIYTKLKFEPSDRLYNYFRFDGHGVTHYYMLESRNYTVSRFGLPFSLLFNKSFLCISFCISLFSFLGSWQLFKMFYEMYPHLHKKIAIATLFLPSLLFWGVSLLKDPICVGAMGYFTYAAYTMFIKNKKIINSIVIIFFSAWLLFNTKPYILYCLAAVFSLWIFLRFRDKIKDTTLRNISTALFVGLAVLVGFLATQSLGQAEAASQFTTDQLLATIQSQQATFFSNKEEGGGSNFSIGSDEGTSNVSGLGLALLFPQGVVNTFFRPFLWDVRSPMMIFSAIEAFFFLALTYMCFKKVGIGNTFKTIFSDPAIAFCFVFALVFGGVIGVTTTNFGALVRYKLPCITFYAMAFILVMDKSGKFPTQYIFSKKFF